MELKQEIFTWAIGIHNTLVQVSFISVNTEFFEDQNYFRLKTKDIKRSFNDYAEAHLPAKMN